MRLKIQCTYLPSDLRVQQPDILAPENGGREFITLKKIYGRFPLENTPYCAGTRGLYSHVHVQGDLSTIKQFTALPSCTIHRANDSAVGQHLRGSGSDEKRNFEHGFSFLFLRLSSVRGKEKGREGEREKALPLSPERARALKTTATAFPSSFLPSLCTPPLCRLANKCKRITYTQIMFISWY